MRILVAVISDISTDRRVLKQALLLKEMGCDTVVLGRHLKDSPPLPPEMEGSRRFRILFAKGAIMYLCFNLRLLFALFFSRRADLYIANDLDTLLPCFIVSRLYQRPLIYDSHEYFTGQHSLVRRKFRQGIWKAMERLVVPRLKWMITVSESIARLYREEYGIDPLVVRNLAPSSEGVNPFKREALGINPDDLLVIIQGSGLHSGRGAVELIGAMALTDRVSLIVAGSGEAVEEMKLLARQKRVGNRVKFLPRMPWEKMMEYTKCCDAGLSLDRNTCRNHLYSLPNKLFDYISAGIPVIASQLPEVAKIITDYGCGIIINEVTPELIAEALVKLRDNKVMLESMKERAEDASRQLRWENEALKEQDLFKSVLNTKT